MVSKKNLKQSVKLPPLAIAVVAGLLFAQVGSAEVSLQEVYDNAAPGEGYDKLMILDPQETYIGDLWIAGRYTVCIHGNGALVIPEGNACAIQVYGSLLDVDHLVIEANHIGLLYGIQSSGTVKNNTIAGASQYGIRTYDVNMANGVEIFSNIIVNNGYGIYCNDGYLPEYIAYNDLWDNPQGNYIKYCEGWGGGSEEPFAPYPGTGEIHEDPLFLDPANHDYRLAETSPCRGAGRYGEDMGAIPYMTEVEDMAGGSLPGKLWLSQNYPNPFNSATVVQYRLSNPAHVRLEVFDLVGQRVALLVNSRQEAGHRSVLWNAAELPSGVYFYRLTAGSLSDMKRMILLK